MEKEEVSMEEKKEFQVQDPLREMIDPFENLNALDTSHFLKHRQFQQLPNIRDYIVG